MARAVACPSCGAKTGARRDRCPRCRAPLASVPAAQPAAGGRGRASTPVVVLCVAAIALTAGAAARMGTAEEAIDATPLATVDPSTAAATPAEDESRAAVASMDSSRAGLAAYTRGDVAGSIEQFSEAVAADPKNPQALNNLGQVLVRSGRVSEAIQYFDQAVELEDGVWTYHFNRARAYGELQQWGRAIAGYRDAARLFPDDYATAFNLARALQASGDSAGAIAEFRRAIVLAPGEPDFHLSLAYALETAQKPDEALTTYRQYLELQDSGPAAEKVRKRVEELESKR